MAFTAVSPYLLDLVLTFTFSGATQIEISSDATTTFTGTAVPEPSSMAIAGLGLLGMIGYGLRRRRKETPLTSNVKPLARMSRTTLLDNERALAEPRRGFCPSSTTR